MAIWNEVVDKFRGRRTLDKLSRDELDREKIKLDQQERKQIQQLQQLERQKEGYFAQGIRETSSAMKLYYARKVKELDSDVRLNDRVLKALAHKIRIFNGIISVQKWMQILSEDKKSILNKISLTELTQWIEKNTVDGELRQQQLENLVGAVESGTGIIGEVGSAEEEDVQKIFELMRDAPVAAKAPEEIAKESMPQVNTILREKERAS